MVESKFYFLHYIIGAVYNTTLPHEAVFITYLFSELNYLLFILSFICGKSIPGGNASSNLRLRSDNHFSIS